jgi:hypothetical protein
MAANNLATLVARRRTDWTRQPDLARRRREVSGGSAGAGNLAEITARMGQDEEARQLFEEVLRKFPDYTPAGRNYERRYRH